MLCVADVPVDGPGWAEAAVCLERRRLHEAAQQARRRAWEADPSLGPELWVVALDFAHRTGDDRLAVDIGRTLDLADADLQGHVAMARAAPGSDAERSWLEAVPRASCQHSLSRFRLAALHGSEGRLKSEVRALREVIEWTQQVDPPWGRAVQWQAWNLVDVASVQVASVYASIGRADVAAQYASPIAEGDDHARLHAQAVLGWSALAAGDNEEALQLATSAGAAVPEAHVLLVRIGLGSDAKRAAAARAHDLWKPARDALEAYAAASAQDPRAARRGLSALDLPDGALASGASSPAAPLWYRSYAVSREERRARRNPVVAALVADARSEIDTALGFDLLAQAAHGVARIDAALADVDRSDGWPQDLVPPRPYSAADFGWTELPLHAPVRRTAPLPEVGFDLDLDRLRLIDDRP